MSGGYTLTLSSSLHPFTVTVIPLSFRGALAKTEGVSFSATHVQSTTAAKGSPFPLILLDYQWFPRLGGPREIHPSQSVSLFVPQRIFAQPELIAHSCLLSYIWHDFK